MGISFVTTAEAGDLAAQAALLLGLPSSLWIESASTVQDAALQLATTTIKAGRYRWYGNEGDGALKLATVAQALAFIDQQANGEGQARLMRQGVVEFGQGRQRVVFQGARGTSTMTAMSLCAAARELLRPLHVGAVGLS